MPAFFRDYNVNFKTVKGLLPDLPPEVIKKMSTDQTYLYRIVKAVATGSGYFNKDVGLRTASPGKMHNARWITLANRVLHLYCSTKKPFRELTRLVGFLVEVYAPAWFGVVESPSFLDAPRTFQKLIASLNAFPFTAQEKKKMEKVINGNSFFAHPENVLVSMLTDPNNSRVRQ